MRGFYGQVGTFPILALADAGINFGCLRVAVQARDLEPAPGLDLVMDPVRERLRRIRIQVQVMGLPSS